MRTPGPFERRLREAWLTVVEACEATRGFLFPGHIEHRRANGRRDLDFRPGFRWRGVRVTDKGGDIGWLVLQPGLYVSVFSVALLTVKPRSGRTLSIEQLVYPRDISWVCWDKRIWFWNYCNLGNRS